MTSIVCDPAPGKCANLFAVILEETMRMLKSLGTEQARKVYRNHGAGENTFGVSFADLKKLKNKIKCNHLLAWELWSTGNLEARILACWAVDPAALSQADLNRWASELDGPILSDYLAAVSLQTPFALACLEQWIKSDREYITQMGWTLLALMARDSSQSNGFFEPYLERIEKKIHTEPSRVRYQMNAALIAIGGHNDDLKRLALAAATRIGKVKVDHGVTGCKTPDAVTYINKVADRRGR